MVVPLVAFLVGGLGLLLVLGPRPDIVTVTGGEPEVKGEPNESEEESECRLEERLTRRWWEGVSRPTRN